MVFAVQCPSPACRKYMLVEDADRTKTVPCLLCKTPIRLGTPKPPEKPGPGDPGYTPTDKP